MTLFCLFHACAGLILPSLARLRTMYIKYVVFFILYSFILFLNLMLPFVIVFNWELIN